MAISTIQSCREKCVEANTNLIKVKFFDALTLEEDTLAFDRVLGIGAPIIADSINLYDSKDTLTVFNLPGSAGADQAHFLFERTVGNKLIQDTLSLTYARTLELIKPNCGLNEIIRDLNILSHSFDSAVVVFRELSNQNDQINIHVFIEN
ncbi:MAG: DUF6452 family protein [Microscillaceae bacterium]|nr:DUF6452 family protein [Microscillaceae bacterium]